MIRSYLRSLKSMQADLRQRQDAENLGRAAAQLFAYYDRRARLLDSLTGSEPPPKTQPAYRRGRPKRRQRRLKTTTANYALAILREAMEPLSASEIRERLAAEFKAVGRQAMSYTLKGLERDGRVERLRATTGRARHLWRAVDKGD